MIRNKGKLGLDLMFTYCSYEAMNNDLMPGQLLARGVCRHLRQYDFLTLEEFVPAPGLRVDVMALGPKGEIWVVECKSSRVDFQTDSKWQGYLDWCDRYFWAVDSDFPAELLPSETGLILADAYDAEIHRMGPEDKLPAARRKKLTLKFARNAADRLRVFRDPGIAAFNQTLDKERPDHDD